jgi:precorrin-6B methylase 2
MEPIDLTIELNGDWSREGSIRLKTALEYAIKDDPKLSNDILTMHGMSGHRYRRLINKLVELTPDARYLEIGSWKGSTACSAMYGNTCKVLCIENWDIFFEAPKAEFFQNVVKFKNDNVSFQQLESEYAKVDYSQIGKFNIYLFDGPHAEHDQYAGITITQEALDDEYILIVDDWNWPEVRNGTLNALKEIDNKIISSIVVRSTQNDKHPQPANEQSEWHNGYFIALIEK